MPTFTILGATGNVGLSLLKVLTKSSTQESDVKIKAYVRSKAKLLSLYPAAGTLPNVTIVEGQLHDPSVLDNCVRDVDAVFLTLATVYNAPDCSIAQQSAGSVVKALERLQSEDSKQYKAPRLVILSSATVSETMWREEDMPVVAHHILALAASYIYADLSQAERYLRSYPQSDSNRLFHFAFVKPGGLIHDEQRGHVLNAERSKTFTSYMDLAQGMVEIAGNGAGGDAAQWQWDARDVSVNSAADGGAKLDFWTRLWFPWFLVCGITSHVKGRLMGYPCDF